MAMRRAAAKGIVEAATGLRGFDDMTGGGLPRGRVSVAIGGAGSGKRARLMGARWEAFDAIDVLLDLLPDADARRREISRLQERIESKQSNLHIDSQENE